MQTNDLIMIESLVENYKKNPTPELAEAVKNIITHKIYAHANNSNALNKLNSILKDINRYQDSLIEKRSIFQKIGDKLPGKIRFKRAILTVGIVSLTLTGCNSLFGTSSKHKTYKVEEKDDKKNDKKNDETKDFDQDRYRRAPLTDKTIEQEATEMIKMLAENGVWDKATFNSEEAVMMTIMNSYSSLTPERAKSLDLPRLMSETEIETTFNDYWLQINNSLMTGQFTGDFTKTFNGIRDGELLNKGKDILVKVIENPSEENKAEWKEFALDILHDHGSNLSPAAAAVISMMNDTLSTYRILDEDTRTSFIGVIKKCQNGDGTSNNELLGTFYNGYKMESNKFFQNIVEYAKFAKTGKEKDLTKQEQKEIKTDLGGLSAKELSERVKKNIKDLVNADIKTREVAKEAQLRHLDASESPVQKVSPNDKIVGNKIVEDGGVVNQIGDEVSTNLDSNSQSTSLTPQQLRELYNQGFNDALNNVKKSRNDFSSEVEYQQYMSGYNYGKTHNVTPPKEDNIQKPDDTPTTPPGGDQSNTDITDNGSGSGEIVEDKKDEIFIPNGDYIQNPDGTYSPAEASTGGMSR